MSLDRAVSMAIFRVYAHRDQLMKRKCQGKQERENRYVLLQFIIQNPESNGSIGFNSQLVT